MKRLSLITSIVICLGAIATIALNVQSCRSRRKEPVEPAPPKPLSAAERTQAMIEERMADPAYTNGLEQLAARQMDLARQRTAVRNEILAWSKGFLVSNEEAKAAFEKLQAMERDGTSPTNAAFSALAGRLDELMAEDPEGKLLLRRRDEVEEAVKEHQAVIHDFVGARLRRQRTEHLDEAAALAIEQRRKLIEEGKIKPYTPPPAPTNRPQPRKDGWWTNQPPRAIPAPPSPGKGPASSGPQAEKTP